MSKFCVTLHEFIKMKNGERNAWGLKEKANEGVIVNMMKMEEMNNEIMTKSDPHSL